MHHHRLISQPSHFCLVATTCLYFLILVTTLHSVNGEQFPTILTSDRRFSIAAIPLAADKSVQEPGVVLPTEKKECRKFVMVMAKRLMKYLTECIHILKENHPEKGGFDKYFQCAIKCSMKDVQMIDENYKFSNATFVTFVTKHIGEEYHNLVYRLAYNCINDFGPKITPDGDALCLTYGNFINNVLPLIQKCEHPSQK